MLSAPEVTFLRQLAAKEVVSRSRTGLPLRMWERYELGVPSGGHLTYGGPDSQNARAILRDEGLALQAPLAAHSRSEAPAGPSEKTGSLPVLNDIVAVVPIGMTGVSAPARGLLAMQWRDALALPYDVLLVCENLEPMMWISQYTWLERFYAGRRVLALFRGMPRLFPSDAASNLMKADDRATLAFFDFDPKGLSMAASLPRREALCLPDWTVLDAAVRAKRRSLFARSARASATHLERLSDPDIAQAWKRMKALSWGLDQESFPREDLQ